MWLLRSRPRPPSLDEFFSPVSAGIKPRAQRLRFTRRSFSESNYGFVGDFEAIVRDSQNGCIDLFLSALKIWTMWRSDCESTILNT